MKNSSKSIAETIPLPFKSINGFPGKREEEYLAGIIPKTFMSDKMFNKIEKNENSFQLFS